MRSRANATATGVAVLAVGLVAATLPTLGAASASAMIPRDAGPATHAAAKPPYHPSRLTHLGDARQVIVVTATSFSTSHATLRMYRKESGGWDKKFKTMPARIGTNGFAHIGKRKQDTGETPAGTFRLLRAFGSAPDPGTSMKYRQFDRNDWWPYDPRDPRTYNVAQFRGRSSATDWRKSWAEHLWSFHDQYKYAVVLDYNLPSGIYRSGTQRFAAQTADTSAGGGIFLHVRGAGSTAGCVAVGPKRMRKILRWLDPAMHPVIVMAPMSAIGRA